MVLILIYICKYSSLNNIYQCRKKRFQRRWCLVPYIYYEANHINIFNLKKTFWLDQIDQYFAIYLSIYLFMWSKKYHRSSASTADNIQ